MANPTLFVGRGAPDQAHEGGDPTPFATDPPCMERLQVGVCTHGRQLVPKESEGALVTDRRIDRHRHRPYAVFCAASLAVVTSEANAAGSRAASSARLLRSS